MNASKPDPMRRSSKCPGTSTQRGQHQSTLPSIEFFTIQEVAERLSVSTRTVRRWIDNGELVAHRIGGVRIAEGDLRAFIAARRQA
jgi:excisionase family DNA binding protein